MRILFDNVNPHSSSGPNSFAKRLMKDLKSKNHEASHDIEDPNVQLSFISFLSKKAPTALRLDGIYFNTRQNWREQNEPIKRSFLECDMVIYQSEFNKMLTEKYFGPAKSYSIINNGTSFEDISKIPPLQHPILNSFSEVWSCSSSWRPHKRLRENIRYFLEYAPKDSCLVIAGENPDVHVKHERIFYVGHLPWENCIALYKKSKVFLHLAFLDHCPNVVIDARACGCDLVVASSGGTKEIVEKNSKIIQDVVWDLSPLDLYSPPDLDFSKFTMSEAMCSIDISSVGDRYQESLMRIA